MWFSFEDGALHDIEADDPRSAFELDLLRRLEGMRAKHLRIVLGELRLASNALIAAGYDWASSTSPDAERPFVERSFAGEVQLHNPPEDFSALLVGASLHAQVLRAPIRWGLDLREAARHVVWGLVEERRAAKRARRAAALTERS